MNRNIIQNINTIIAVIQLGNEGIVFSDKFNDNNLLPQNSSNGRKTGEANGLWLFWCAEAFDSDLFLTRGI